MSSVSLCSKCENTFSFRLDSRPSDLLELLRGYYVPEPREAAGYKQSKKNAEKVLSEVDRTIGNIGTILEQLQSAREDISRYIEEGSALLSPIRRMPNEVLEAIFDPLSDRIAFHNGFFAKRPHGWAIRQVCKRWRDVVISKASYWTQLSFHERGSTFEKHHYNASLTNLLLAYSGDAPLRVKLDVGKDGCGELDDFTTDLVETNAHRIQSLTITLWKILDISNIDRLSLLEDLYIMDDNFGMGEDASLLSSALCFQKSSGLRSVKLFLTKLYPALQLPWESVQSISLYTRENGQLAFLRDHCPNLRDLKWRYPSLTAEAVRMAGENFCFPNVEKFILELDYYPPTSGAVVIEHFQFPVLKELKITIDKSGRPPDGNGFQTALMALLSQHSSTLQFLHLENIPLLAGSEPLSMLAILSQLRRFRYTLLPNSNLKGPAFYDLLTSKSDSLVPDLEALEIEGAKLVVDAAVLDGLAHRRRNQNGLCKGSLKQLSLTFENIEFRENVLTGLESLRRDGLVICINGDYFNWQ